MNQKIENIFINLADVEVPKDLRGKILAKIAYAQRRQLRRKALLYRAGISFSSIAAVAALVLVGRAIILSDFWSIASLSFSDFGSVVANWQEFVWSLLETLPAEQFAGVVAPMFVLLILIKQYNIQKSFAKFNSFKI